MGVGEICATLCGEPGHPVSRALVVAMGGERGVIAIVVVFMLFAIVAVVAVEHHRHESVERRTRWIKVQGLAWRLLCLVFEFGATRNSRRSLPCWFGFGLNIDTYIILLLLLLLLLFMLLQSTRRRGKDACSLRSGCRSDKASYNGNSESLWVWETTDLWQITVTDHAHKAWLLSIIYAR